MLVDHRKGKFFGGITLHEYDSQSKKMIGPSYHIFEGTSLGKTEGPHIYNKDGFYYLITAEGGTEYDHAVTIARSKKITGPYEAHPNNPIITSSNNPHAPLQKTGHGDLFQGQLGGWHIVFLVGRPLKALGRCTLGRESALQHIDWPEGGWPRLSQGGNEPTLEIEAAQLSVHEFIPKSTHDDFEDRTLNLHFQSLRVPFDEKWISLSERPGYLRLKGRESLSSLNEQSLIARRVQHFDIEVSTSLEFEPANFHNWLVWFVITIAVITTTCIYQGQKTVSTRL